MDVLIKFKNELKKAQAEDRKILKSLELEIDKARRVFRQITNISPQKFEQYFPVLYKEILLTDEYKSYIRKNNFLFSVDLNELLEEILLKNRRFYNMNQEIINGMDNEKIINYIDIQRLLMHLATSDLSPTETFKIFQMVVAFDMEYLQTKKNISCPNSEYIFLLSDFFKKDGTFQYNENINQFKTILNQIFLEFKSSYETLLIDGIIPQELYEKLTSDYDRLINAYVKYLVMSNEKYKVVEEKTRDEGKPTIVPIKKPAFGELKKYYRNGIIVSIPENIGDFTQLLDECGIHESEKRHILKQINNKLHDMKEEKLLSYLFEEDKAIYTETISWLKSSKTDANTHMYISGLLEDIRVCLELLDELYQKESYDIKERIEEVQIYAQIEELLYYVKKTIGLEGLLKVSKH